MRVGAPLIGEGPWRARVSAVVDRMAVERARQNGAGEAGQLTPQAPLGTSRNRRAKGGGGRQSQEWRGLQEREWRIRLPCVG